VVELGRTLSWGGNWIGEAIQLLKSVVLNSTWDQGMAGWRFQSRLRSTTDSSLSLMAAWLRACLDCRFGRCERGRWPSCAVLSAFDQKKTELLLKSLPFPASRSITDRIVLALPMEW
jgi:hypothetical protein